MKHRVLKNVYPPKPYCTNNKYLYVKLCACFFYYLFYGYY